MILPASQGCSNIVSRPLTGFVRSLSSPDAQTPSGGPAPAGQPSTREVNAGVHFLRHVSETIWTACDDDRDMLTAALAFVAARVVGEGLRGVGLALHWHNGSAAQRAIHRTVRDHMGTMSHFPSHLQRTFTAVLSTTTASAKVTCASVPLTPRQCCSFSRGTTMTLFSAESLIVLSCCRMPNTGL